MKCDILNAAISSMLVTLTQSGCRPVVNNAATENTAERALSALMVFAGRQEGHPAHKN